MSTYIAIQPFLLSKKIVHQRYNALCISTSYHKTFRETSKINHFRVLQCHFFPPKNHTVSTPTTTKMETLYQHPQLPRWRYSINPHNMISRHNVNTLKFTNNDITLFIVVSRELIMVDNSTWSIAILLATFSKTLFSNFFFSLCSSSPYSCASSLNL